MKLIVSSSHLLKQLSAINGVITSNPVVPILENFLFEMNEGILRITASDMQTSMIAELDVDAQEDGGIAIPAKILLETLRNLPEQPVTFSIDDSTYSIEINSSNGRYKLSGENATDFPKAPEVTDGNAVNVSSDLLGKALNHTIFATSNDELRPAMNGVFMKLEESNTVFVGTDSHRLVKYDRMDIASGMEHQMIIPRKALTLLKATLPQENTNVSVRFNESNAFFHFNNIDMVCRLIDERFPDYENVIPVDNNNVMSIDREELLGSLKRIVIYSNNVTHLIQMKITGNELGISSEDLDFSNEANEKLICEHEGEDIEIGFNAKFLIEMLSNMDSEKVVFRLSVPNKAGIVLPGDKDENEDLMMLVMPLMLDNYA